ncbi:hypothetical protein DPEC_G00060650, partial [Dallia pectoralis]
MVSVSASDSPDLSMVPDSGLNQVQGINIGLEGLFELHICDWTPNSPTYWAKRNHTVQGMNGTIYIYIYPTISSR